MHTRILLIIGGLGILSAGLLLFRLSHEVADQRAQQTAAKAFGLPAAPGTSEGGRPAGGQVPIEAAVTPPAPPAGPEFQKWLASEATQVGRTNVNTEQKKAQLAQIISGLTEAQARQLAQTALNTSATAGEKILSVYLLVEGGARTRAELQQLLTTAPSVTGPQPAHSEGELRSVQERSFRVMAVDGMIAQSKTDPAALETLERTIPSIPDAYVKQYAQRRLSELKGH
jgi:hypothetical protein